MAVAVPAAARSPYAVFRSRSFSLLWVGQFISAAGSALSALAASILVFRMTGSALSVGLILVATALPSLALGLFAGVVVDRSDRKRLMMAADLARAVLVALVPPLVLGVGAFRLPGGIAWLYALTILAGCATQFFEPAFAAVLPELASEEDLAAANALMQISSFGSTAVGFAAAGLIATALPIQWAFYLDAFSFLVSATCVALAALPRLAAADDTSGAAVWRNLRAGAGFLSASRVLRSLFVVMVPASLALGLYNALLLPFAVRALHATSFQYSLQEAVTSVGFVAGSLLLAGLADRFHEGQLIAVSFLGMALLSIVYSGLTSVPLAIVVVAVAGFLNAPSAAGRSLLVQRQTPREMRGRVFSAFFVARDLLFVVGMAAAGLADLVNVRTLVFALGCLLLLSGALCAALPGLRQSAAEWWRAAHLLRAAGAPGGLGPGRVPTLADVDLLLGLVPPLAHLDPPERADLLGGRVYQGVPAGATVLRQRDAGDVAYFVLAGRVAVGRAGGAGQDDTPLALLNAGDFFGEIAALTAVPRTANVVTDRPSTLLEVPAPVLRHLMRHSEVNRLLLSTMTARLSELRMIDLPRQAALDQQTLVDLRTPPPSPPAASPEPAPAFAAPPAEHAISASAAAAPAALAARVRRRAPGTRPPAAAAPSERQPPAPPRDRPAARPSSATRGWGNPGRRTRSGSRRPR